MQPYSTPFYFVLLGLALVPLVIAHYFGKKWMPYQVLLSIAFLWLTFGGTASLWSLIGFGLFETALVRLYLWYRRRGNAAWIFVSAVILSIAPLTLVKLTPLITPARPESILGFLGISYLTFKAVGVILETRDGLIKEIPLKDFVYFLYFYPTISSGPIDRYRRFQKELTAPLTQDYWSYVDRGVFYIFQGFLYKFIIGYILSQQILHPLAIEAVRAPSFWNIAGSMYSYGLYLFFDFAGYSLFAIGVSLLMGYDIPHNFNKPFLSRNIKDFWNRWHITLSFWFRDFVAMRLAKWLMTRRITRNMVLIANVGYLASMGLMGFWHGLTWYYILYGFYHAGLLIGYDAWLRLKKKRRWQIPDNRGTRALGIFITVNLVFVGFLIFSGIPNTIILNMLHKNVPLPNF